MLIPFGMSQSEKGDLGRVFTLAVHRGTDGRLERQQFQLIDGGGG
jgi:hypothetical protein